MRWILLTLLVSAAATEAGELGGMGLSGVLSLDTVQRRAQASGWKILSRDDDADYGYLELDRGKYYGYVSLFDLAFGDKHALDRAIEQSAHKGLRVEVDEWGGKRAPAQAILSTLLKQPLETLTGDGLRVSLKQLGWRIGKTDFEERDGLALWTLEAENATRARIVVDFVALAPKVVQQGTAAVVGRRFLAVGVCKDCQARKTGVITGLLERQAAQKLLQDLVRAN